MNTKHNLFASVLVAWVVLGLATAGTAEENRSAGVERIRLLPPGEGNPRNSEGDFIALRDGRILFAYSHFTGGGSDHAAAHIAGRYSSDGGRTWTDEDVMIVPREGDFNVMSVSLLRLQDESIALFYLRKNSLVDCRPMMRLSRDEGQTWSDPVLCIAEVGYNVLNNDRAVQLTNGRIILPVALHNTPAQNKFDGRGIISCHFSDDQGRTWRQSKTVQQGAKLTLQEPGLVQLKDDRLMMFCRTTHGSQYISYSTDWGDTWSPFEPSNIISPCSPATIERIPSTGDLLLVWNDHARIDGSLRGKRTPLNVAISTDEGQTWKNVKTIEDDRNGWYCYIAADFVGDHILLGHCAGDRRTGGLNATQITRLPVGWLYEPAETLSLGEELRERCVGILKQGLEGMKVDMPKEDFWPAIHAAEGLTLAGHGDVVREKLTPLLVSETDAQKRCGLARELVRAGDRALDLRERETAAFELPLTRFAEPAARGWRSGNTHLHLRNLSRDQAVEYLRTLPRADGLEMLFFDQAAMGPFERLENRLGVWTAEAGHAEVYSYARGLSKGVRLQGGADRQVTLTLPQPVACQALKLGVERVTSRAPYAVEVEAKVGDAWQKVWGQGEKTPVGHAQPVAGTAKGNVSSSQFRFRCTSRLGAIIVDLPDALFNGFFHD